MRYLRKYDQQYILPDIEIQLLHEPNQETRNRKRLRPNELTKWELRAGRFRIFYDVDEEKKFVKIEAVGYKEGNKLYLQGKEYKL